MSFLENKRNIVVNMSEKAICSLSFPTCMKDVVEPVVGQI